jgi:YD repeat-containing protein
MSEQVGGGLGSGGRARRNGRRFGLVRRARVPAIAFLAFLLFLALSPAAAVSDPPANAFRFIYDADGRLKAAIDPEGDAAAYGWAAVGNMLSITRHDSDHAADSVARGRG